MSDWFLPTAERAWTSGNLVVPHVHGADYFARLLEVIGATEPGDRIFLTDWRGDADEKMTKDGPTVGDVLASASRRGVEVRALLWRSHPGKLNSEENDHLGAVINEAGGEALLDERIRRGGSHHQKLFVVRRKGRPEEDVAFVGGIDLCHGRRDDAEHAGDPQAPPLDERYGPTPPWHDAMAEIRGPAVAHVLDTFAERWDDPTPLDHRNPYRAVMHRLVKMPRHPEQLPERWDPPPEVGPHQVQLLRTYPSKRPPYPFAPDGERTIARGYSHAFDRARRLIYIEDQYFWSEVVATALAEALRREPDLHVIAVIPRYPEEDNRIGGPPMIYGQREAWEALNAAGGERFAMFDIENAAGTPIYVHAKVCVVDDHWMTIGSDNLNLRSWTHDSELTCAIVDPDGELPRSVRASLWAEHLGLRDDDPRLTDLAGAMDLWNGQVGAPGSRIRPHVPSVLPARTRLWARAAYRTLYDPDGRPRKLRGTTHF
ncbi:phospholipase D family protein [Nocardioides sp. HM23]|uniref:phospholipase D family protein n=1 Tax=Nocardioides bizhenqiangii TaxID=3095076 RepID=UPI002ACA6440|nr:phospholipase D family protein [Nocardioides sp. HM23]MDZ5622505.1 phospholipase D family protein [Nocardioides sp. HM23]